MKTMTLGTVAQYINGRAFKPEEWEETGRPIIRIQNLTNTTDVCHRTKKTYEDKYLIKDGDLLFAWSASLGAHIWHGEDGWLNQHIFKIIPNDDIDKMYLYYYLIHVVDQLYAKTHGSGMVHITLKPFKATAIPVPDIAEQQHIVDRIESLFAKLNEAQEKAQAVVDGFEDRKAAILHKAFTGELIGVSGHTVPLDTIVDNIRIGPFGSALHKQDYVVGGIPVVNPKHIMNQQIKPDEKVTITVEKADDLNSYKLKTGDIVMGRRGEMGRSAPVTEKENGWLCGTGSLIIRLKEGYDAEFYSQIIGSNSSVRYLEENCVGSTMKNLNEKIVKSLPVPSYSREEQKKVVSIVSGLVDKELQAKDVAEQVCDKIDTMKQSVLAKAFRGELGTNDPSDENATELLKQILQEN